MSDHDYGEVMTPDFITKATPHPAPFGARILDGNAVPLSGPSSLPAATYVAGAPDQAVSREVELIDLALLPARRTKWSEPNGSVVFDNLPAGRRYLMVGYDHTGTHDPVAKIITVPNPEVPE